MLLRDSHAAPAAPALTAYRGVKKILEPMTSYWCEVTSPPERAASLPSSPAPSRRASLDAAGGRSLHRRASCESGIFSVACEEEWKGACPRCLWWRGSERCCCRAGSVYTDSSDDAASLAGSESPCCDAGPSRRVKSAQISKIVEYFERKGADFTCERVARGPSRYRLRTGPCKPPAVCEGAVRSKLSLFDKKS